MMSNRNCCINIDLIGLLFLMRLKVVVQLVVVKGEERKGREGERREGRQTVDARDRD